MHTTYAPTNGIGNSARIRKRLRNKMEPKLLIYCIFALLIICGCTDPTIYPDNETEHIVAQTASTSKFHYSLGYCTQNKYGMKMFVPEEQAYYVCASNGSWIRIMVDPAMGEYSSSQATGAEEYSSSSKKIDSDSSKKDSKKNEPAEKDSVDSKSMYSKNNSDDEKKDDEKDIEKNNAIDTVNEEVKEDDPNYGEVITGNIYTADFINSDFGENFGKNSEIINKNKKLCKVAFNNKDYADYVLVDPNDEASQDSLSHRLANGGAVLHLLPDGKYSLRFKKNADTAPTLNLYKNLYPMKTVHARESSGYWFYDFTIAQGEANEYNFYYSMLINEDCSTYKGKVEEFYLEGVGEYSSHFEVNLIIIGKYMGTSDEVSEKEFAEALKKRFNEALNDGDVYLDKVNLLYASEHPTNGKNFQNTSEYAIPRSIYYSDFDLLNHWDGHEYALNIILGHYIDEENILGFSPRFGANLNGKTNGCSYVAAGTHSLTKAEDQGYGPTQYKTVQRSSEQIINTIVHETGHYFGLRHTTSNPSELKNDIDKSNVEDGVKDTPYCKAVHVYGLGDMDITMCKDAGNILFPYNFVGRTINKSYTTGQLKIFKKNLTLLEH